MNSSNIIYYETCENCWRKVDITKMTVKETIDGNVIYCPECIEKRKFLYSEIKKIYNIDLGN